MYKRKIEITNNNIKNALISLLEHNQFELITINQIVDKAQITRSTFYRYYEDKYELLSEIEDEIINVIIENRKKIEKKYMSLNTLDTEMFKLIFIVLDPYSETIRCLLNYNGPPSFEMKLKKVLTQRFLDFDNLKYESKVRVDLTKEYMYAILIKTFQYWSTNKNEIDIDEIAKTLKDVQLKGIRKTINI